MEVFTYDWSDRAPGHAPSSSQPISSLLTSSCTASTFGWLPVRRSPDGGVQPAVVASDLDLWWVLLDGDANATPSPSPAMGPSGAGRGGGAAFRPPLWWRQLDGDPAGLSEPECDPAASALRWSDRMSLRRRAPLEWRCAEMCMSEE